MNFNNVMYSSIAFLVIDKLIEYIHYLEYKNTNIGYICTTVICILPIFLFLVCWSNVIFLYIYIFLDVDECTAGTTSCDTTNEGCSNTIGSFTCTCNSGYELNVDGFTCNGTIIVVIYLINCYYYITVYFKSRNLFF